MKTTPILLLLFLCPALLWAQHDTAFKKAFFKSWEKELISLGDGSYAQQYEVSNFHYRLFLEDIARREGPEKRQEYYPDTTAWTREFPEAMNEPMEQYYFYHPAYDDYPVVNISYEGAMAFAEWLNLNFEAYGKSKLPAGKWVLPSAAQWEKAAAGSEAALQEAAKQTEETASMNLKYAVPGEELSDFARDGGLYMREVDYFEPTGEGFYSLFGNVAEMTDQKGLAKGGSWNHRPEECTAIRSQAYDGPSPMVGFRLFYVVEGMTAHRDQK